VVRIQDEFGQAWWVAKGDPVWDAVKALQRLYYTWIVLPRAFIRQGGIISSYHLTRGAGWLDHMWQSRYNSSGERKRAMRLVECLRELALGAS